MSSRLRIAVAVLAVCSLAACPGASSPSSPDTGRPAGRDAGPACDEGLTRCSGTCVDTTSDPVNCGECDVICNPGESCKASICVAPDCRETGTCPSGQYCDAVTGACVQGCTDDTGCGQSETCEPTSHACICKAGYRRCQPGGACLAASTPCPAPACGKDRTACDGSCVDLWSDPRHCGGCGQACQPGEVCKGTCQRIDDCRQTPCFGLTWCDTSLGLCKPGCSQSRQCDPSEICDTQKHACVCPAGSHRCNGVCVSDRSPATCGSSCSPCPYDPLGQATCDGTSCGVACNPGHHLCDGRCVSSSSPDSCGASCTPCPTDRNGQASCDGTSCGIACNPGYHLCNGVCVSSSSTASCGSSCTPCPTDPNGYATCDGARCGITCDSDALMCAGACAQCPANGTGLSCSGSQCVASGCVSGSRLCSGVCATCPSGGVTGLDCSGTICIATSCASGYRVCQGKCAGCPSAGVASTDCSGASCIATACQAGHGLCAGTCSACPTTGVATTSCTGSSCVAATCLSGYQLCQGQCTTCPTAGVLTTGCSGTQCVATSCQKGFYPCATGCCAWNAWDQAYVGSVSSLSSSGHLITMATDSNGVDQIAYYDVAAKAAKYRRWNGSAWEVSTIGTAYDSSIGFALKGTQPHAVFHQRTQNSSTGKTVSSIRYARYNSGAWSSEQVFTDNGTANYIFSGYPALTVDSYDTPHVTFWDIDYSASSSIRYATNSSGSWATSPTGMGTTFSSELSMVMAGGVARLAFAGQYSIYLATRSSSWPWPSETIGSGAWHSSLAAGPSGTLHAAYSGGAYNAVLKYAVRGASGWTEETVDSSASVGSYASIAVDSRNRPHIAYYDGSNGDLKYAHHDGTRWLISVVDSTGNVGVQCSISLNSSGQPRFAYYDQTRGQLRFAY